METLRDLVKKLKEIADKETLGIVEEQTIIKKVKRELVLNDKVVDYLYNTIKSDKCNHFVFIKDGYEYSYEEITKEGIKKLMSYKGIMEECIGILDENPEYEDVPFVVVHANPYNHRHEGDYDVNAYEDWKIETFKLFDFMFEDLKGFGSEPYYYLHQDEFDFILIPEEIEDKGSKFYSSNFLKEEN